MSLQNAPGEVELPVRARYRHVRVLGLDRRARPADLSRRAVLMTVVAAAVMVVVTAGVLLGPGVESVPGLADLGLLGVALAALVLGLVVSSVLFAVLDAGAPRRDQRRYLRDTGAVPLTGRQQQLLALDAHSDFASGGWNSSLEYQPAWTLLPPTLRARDDDGRLGRGYAAMPLADLRARRAEVDHHYRIASPRDVEAYVVDGLGDRGASRHLGDVLGGEHADAVLARLASLTGESEWDLRERARSVDSVDSVEGDHGGPAPLLRSGDVVHLIGAVRLCFVADLLGVDEAWRLIERIGSVAFGLHDSWESHWRDVRVHVAFTTDSLEAVQAFDDVLARLRRSSWPAARVGFPATSALRDRP